MASKAKYIERAEVIEALEASGVSDATFDALVASYDASNPSAFTNESGLSDEKLAQKALEFTRRHLRRFPNTNSALALSLKALYTGESTSYIP